jgi:hypothetical protein
MEKRHPAEEHSLTVAQPVVEQQVVHVAFPQYDHDVGELVFLFPGHQLAEKGERRGLASAERLEQRLRGRLLQSLLVRCFPAQVE